MAKELLEGKKTDKSLQPRDMVTVLAAFLLGSALLIDSLSESRFMALNFHSDPFILPQAIILAAVAGAEAWLELPLVYLELTSSEEVSKNPPYSQNSVDLV